MHHHILQSCSNPTRMCHTWLCCHVSCTRWIVTFVTLGSTSQSPCHNASSLVDLAWVWMVGTTSVVNSSKFDKLKFVKILENFGISRILTNISQTFKFQLTNYPTFDSISFGLNNSNMITFTITNTNTIWWCMWVF